MSITFTVNKLLKLLDSFSPFARTEEWDNTGLLVGDGQREVRGILLALDPTEDLLAECQAHQCNTIITHHPLIFKPLSQLRPDLPPGRLLFTAVHQGINIIACHTNLDVVPGGVSEALALRLGLHNLQVLHPTAPPPADDREGIGFGRIGELTEPIGGDDFLARLLTALELEAAPVAGPLPAMVRKVAVCGGSGSDLAAAAHRAGADIYVSGEIKHAVARWAEMEEFCLVDAGHYHSENPIIEGLTARLARELAAAGHDLPVLSSRRQQSPFRLHKK
ncbi:Nif3-like dinuclear metal center hexameric protein [Desulfurivibrio alkaliphilus]|uniref:GTP cyclohydrolase 1 type 2 homolog n=1 Tax=Desulfurivibrio alkaliphilus (strain DSM 19089 / UNIQEM U267 / AHT2) TaxID=589865 RepID=D6Z575_DESAT|nr:Nif3-like dinuclear metal center hexameric protein [Desulfurivibrio alkaliphilus]ADH84732.1 protein of unknown function DUF34 [Desulfurivibrio alkaliphilus AHT 2]